MWFGLRNDQKDSTKTIRSIKKIDPYLWKIGYITSTYFSAVVDNEAFFLYRPPLKCLIFTIREKLLTGRDRRRS